MVTCLNASRSRDVGDAIPYTVGMIYKNAIPYMVGVFRKKAIPNIFIYEWIFINLATCLNATRSRDVGDAIPYTVGVFRKDAIPYTVGTIYKDAIPLHGRYVL